MNNTNQYDIIIIGSGPAGYTAAIYAGRAGYTSAVFEKMSPGGQMGITSSIENYPGYTEIDGFSLTEKMMKQAKKFGAVIKHEEVVSAELGGEIKLVKTKKEEYSARAVIIATGARPRYLSVPGEREFTGRGVSYCASCDGMFYKGKTVIVNGGGDTAIEDAMYLSNICEKVIIIHRRSEFRASQHGVNKAREKDNIEFVMDSVVEEIMGQSCVESVKIKNVVTGEECSVPCAGIFIAIGRIPETELFGDQIETDKNGYIVAGEDCKTSLDGVYAVGDVRTKALRQIVTACADGANAVKSAEELLTLSE